MRSIILFLFAVGVLLLAHWAMPRIVGGLRRMSRLPENRLTEDEAVPVWFVGNFERAMAVVLVLANVRGAYALLAAWLGAKLATSWQRLPIDNTDLETSRQVRAGTLVALMAGIISVTFGIVAGLLFRCAFRGG